MNRPQKITLAEMRAAGVRNVLIYCADHRCGHCNIVADDANRRPIAPFRRHAATASLSERTSTSAHPPP
jgi:hypothetical protein